MGRYEIVNRLKKKEIDGNDLLKMYENQEISKDLYDELSLKYPAGKKAPENDEGSYEDYENFDLGSKVYSNIAITFGIIYGALGIFSAIAIGGIDGIVFLFGFVIFGVFLYLSISWFSRVLKGLEQNNTLLKEILKKN